jgi:hypothetical protein
MLTQQETDKVNGIIQQIRYASSITMNDDRYTNYYVSTRKIYDSKEQLLVFSCDYFEGARTHECSVQNLIDSTINEDGELVLKNNKGEDIKIMIFKEVPDKFVL